MAKGKFVTFEGCEGVGKSAQIRYLRAYLDENGVDYLVTREPGGSKISEQIRNIILSTDNGEMSDLCELLLYSASRAQHLSEIVIPALNAGKLVICDRFIESTYAYQGFAKGLGGKTVDDINRIAVGGVLPDLTIFLDLPPEKAFLRKGGADKNDRLERLDMSFHNRVYEGYKEIAKLHPERIVTVDASGTKYQTQSAVLELLKARRILD